MENAVSAAVPRFWPDFLEPEDHNTADSQALLAVPGKALRTTPYIFNNSPLKYCEPSKKVSVLSMVFETYLTNLLK